MFDATPDADSSQPPRRRTQAQIEASRSNGARGRGPATPAGKAASCQNAAKHGLRAQGFALLPDEDAGAFEGLRQRLVEEHDPRGAVEEALVEGLALALWRTRRVEALEVEALTSARERRPSPVYAGGYNPYSPFSWSPERLNTILRYRAGLERSLHRTLKALAERRAARAEAARTNEPGAPVPKARPGPALPCTNESEAPARWAMPPAPNEPPERTRAPGTGPEPNSQKQKKKGRAPSARAAFRHLLGALMLCLACLPALAPRGLIPYVARLYSTPVRGAGSARRAGGVGESPCPRPFNSQPIRASAAAPAAPAPCGARATCPPSSTAAATRP